ncbi:MAG: hypothetical protein LBG72_00410 [Spirochaetaceae bacterium]|jgi:hypothetical protein|nr:hypothetical protein [Spirochaetaceae bacterium]
MDVNILLTGGMTLVSAVSFIVTTTVLVNVTRGELKEFKREFADFKRDVADFKKDVYDFKKDVDTRFSAMDANVNARFSAMDANFNARLGRLEVDVAEIKAICRERSYRETPV